MDRTDEEHEAGASEPSPQAVASDADTGAGAARPSALRRRSRRFGVLAGLIVAAALSGVALSHGVWLDNGGAAPSGPGGAATTSPAPAAGGGSVATAAVGPTDAAAIAAKVDPGLVDINATFSYQGAAGAGTGHRPHLERRGLDQQPRDQRCDAGSASTDIGNGKTYSATVVGYDPSQDIAVLQLQRASGLQTVALGDSSSARVGATVLGIGNAGGIGGTPSSAGGSITALDQSITAAERDRQHDRAAFGADRDQRRHPAW